MHEVASVSLFVLQESKKGFWLALKRVISPCDKGSNFPFRIEKIEDLSGRAFTYVKGKTNLQLEKVVDDTLQGQA